MTNSNGSAVRFEKAGYSSEIGYVVWCAIGIGTENQPIPAIPAAG